MGLGIGDLGLRLGIIFNNSDIFKLLYNNGYLYNKQYKIFDNFIVIFFFICFLIENKKNKTIVTSDKNKRFIKLGHGQCQNINPH